MRGLINGAIYDEGGSKVRQLLPYSMVAIALPLEPKKEKLHRKEMKRWGMLNGEAEHAQEEVDRKKVDAHSHWLLSSPPPLLCLASVLCFAPSYFISTLSSSRSGLCVLLGLAVPSCTNRSGSDGGFFF